MKRHEYCVFNKQYSKSDYNKLVEKIIAHMRKTGEWGKYFPMKISPFAYNCSIANDYYPVDQDFISKHGLNVYIEKPETTEKVSSQDADVKICSVTRKPFKLIKQEVELCNVLGLRPPTVCPEVRRDRMTASLKRALANYA